MIYIHAHWSTLFFRPRTKKDTQPVNSIDFHPSGDFLLAGTQDPHVRVYDIHTLQCYTNNNQQRTHHHLGAITQIQYAPETGRMFATASIDGTVKIWDSVSSQCVRTLSKVHGGGMAVSSVRWTRNEKYLLTAGMDSCLRLWDVANGQLVMTYKGHDQRSQMLQVPTKINQIIKYHLWSFLFLFLAWL